MDVRVGLWRKLSTEEWMLLNCGVGEDSWESLGLQGDQPVHPKGNQSWIFIERTDAEAETPILWPPDAKNWLIWKDPDAGKDWRREEKGTAEDKMLGWHHWLHGLQHSRAPCPSSTPGIYSNSCPLSQWCHPTISSSVVPFSSHLQSFPTSGSFQISQLFPLGSQTIQFQLQHQSFQWIFRTDLLHDWPVGYPCSHINTWLLEKPYPWLDGPLLTK